MNELEAVKRGFYRFTARSRGLVECFYRGQSNYDWWMTPAVFREGHLSFEAQYFQETLMRNPDEYTHLKEFEQLQKMQHFGLPTRLLDITSNPLVALFFACQPHLDNDEDECDGKLTMFLSDKLNSDDKRIRAIMWLVKKSASFDASDITKDLKISIKEFLQYCDDDYVVMPSMNNDRIIRQGGAFIIFGNRISNEDEFSLMPIEYDFENTPLKGVMSKNEHSLIGFTDTVMGMQQAALGQFLSCFVYRIPGKQKPEILQELQSVNISRVSLFPSLAESAHAVVDQYAEVRSWLRDNNGANE